MMPDERAYTGATIQDVARRAQVSTATVSRALNRSASAITISPTTVKRVQEAAVALRYHPNAAARSLRTTKTHTVGIIVSDLMHPFSAEFLQAIYAVCRARGYHVLVGNAEYHAGEGWTMGALGSILSPDRVDGILLLGDVLPATLNQEEIVTFVREHRYVVTVACRPRLAGEIAISVDNVRGVTLALEYLFALGHRSIAYLGAIQSPLSWEEQQRWEAYCSFMEAHGLAREPRSAAIIYDHDLAATREALRRMLDAPTPPTAAFVTNDTSALLLLKAALTCGVRVPEDLSLVGFDGLQSAELSTPGLTTVRQPIEAMGQYAANVLLDEIAAVEPSTVLPEGVSGTNPLIFPPTLVRRDSACPLPP